MTNSADGVKRKLLYCPWQTLMGAHRSNIKNQGWAVAQRRCLNGASTHPRPEVTRIIGSLMLHVQWKDQSSSGECCIVLENWLTGSLIAKSRQRLSLAVCEILVYQASPSLNFWRVRDDLAWETSELHAVNAADKAMKQCVQTFTAGCHGTWSASELSQLCTLAQATTTTYVPTVKQILQSPPKNFAWYVVTWRTLQKPQNCQNWWVLAWKWVLAWDNKVILLIITSRKACSRTLFIYMCKTTFQSHVNHGELTHKYITPWKK